MRSHPQLQHRRHAHASTSNWEALKPSTYLLACRLFQEVSTRYSCRSRLFTTVNGRRSSSTEIISWLTPDIWQSAVKVRMFKTLYRGGVLDTSEETEQHVRTSTTARRSRRWRQGPRTPQAKLRCAYTADKQICPAHLRTGPRPPQFRYHSCALPRIVL